MALTEYQSKALNPGLPWNVDRPEELGPTIMEFLRDMEPFYRRYLQKLYENYQFFWGNQHIRWSRRHDFAVNTDFLHRKGPNIFTHTQTNIVRLVVESLSSMVYGTTPDWSTEAMDESTVEGKRYAAIVEQVLGAYNELMHMDEEYMSAAVVFALFGQVGARIDWDRNSGQVLDVPAWRRVEQVKYSNYMANNPVTMGLYTQPTPVLDAQGQPIVESTWQPVLDANGQQVIKKQAIGRPKVDILTPFEYRREPGSHGMHKSRWVQHIRLLDYDQFLQEYGVLPGRTRMFNMVKPTFANADIHRLALSHFYRMQFVSHPVMGDYGRHGSIYNSKSMRYKVLVVEHFDKPNPRKWPEGRRVVIANGVCTNVLTPDYQTGKMDGWHPFAEAQWIRSIPNSTANGPINDVVIKNRELNVKDSLIATSVRRNMGSQLLVNSSSGIDPQQLTGTPGGVHEVNNINAFRWLHDDMPIPPVITALREMDKMDTFEQSGSGDAVRGDRSVGASSGYQARQYEEREKRRLTFPIKSFERFVSTIGEKTWTCVSHNAATLGDDVIGYLKRHSAGKFSISDINMMLTRQIKPGVDIKVVPSSMAIKSKASQQATLIELAQGPAGVLLNDPEVMDKFLKVFDAEELRPFSGIHRDCAQRENEVFADMLKMGPNTHGAPTPVVVLEDDDELHMIEHTRWFLENKEEVVQNPWLLKLFEYHMEWHRIQKQEKMGEQLPGTAVASMQMGSISSQSPAPNLQQIHEYNVNKMQSGTGGGAPQSPSQPAPEPGTGGGQQTDPNAPSQNTPSAAAEGGQ